MNSTLAQQLYTNPLQQPLGGGPGGNTNGGIEMNPIMTNLTNSQQQAPQLQGEFSIHQGLPSMSASRYLPLHPISFTAFLLTKMSPRDHESFLSLYASLHSHLSLNIDQFIQRLTWTLHHAITPGPRRNGPEDVMQTFSDISVRYPGPPIDLCHQNVNMIYPISPDRSGIYLTPQSVKRLQTLSPKVSHEAYFILLLSELLSRAGYQSLPLNYMPLTSLCGCYTCPRITTANQHAIIANTKGKYFPIYRLVPMPLDIKFTLSIYYPLYALQRQNGILQNHYQGFYSSILTAHEKLQNKHQHPFNQFASHFFSSNPHFEQSLMTFDPNLASSSLTAAEILVSSTLHAMPMNKTAKANPLAHSTPLTHSTSSTSISTNSQTTPPETSSSGGIKSTKSSSGVITTTTKTPTQQPNSPITAALSLIPRDFTTNTMFIESTLCWIRGVSDNKIESRFILEKVFFIIFLLIATMLAPFPEFIGHLMLPALRYHRPKTRNVNSFVQRIQRNVNYRVKQWFYKIPLTGRMINWIFNNITNLKITQLFLFHFINLNLPEILSTHDIQNHHNNHHTTQSELSRNTGSHNDGDNIGDPLHLPPDNNNNNTNNQDDVNVTNKSSKGLDETSVVDMIIQSFYRSAPPPESKPTFQPVPEQKKKQLHQQHHHHHLHHNHLRNNTKKKYSQEPQLIGLRQLFKNWVQWGVAWCQYKFKWFTSKHEYHYRIAQDVVFLSRIERYVEAKNTSAIKKVGGFFHKLNSFIHNAESSNDNKSSTLQDGNVDNTNNNNKNNNNNNQGNESKGSNTNDSNTQLELIHYSNVPLSSIHSLIPHTTSFTPPTHDLTIISSLVLFIFILMAIRGEFATIIYTIYDTITHNIALAFYTLLSVFKSSLKSFVGLLSIYRIVIIELFATGECLYPLQMGISASGSSDGHQLAELFILKNIISTKGWSPLYNYVYSATLANAIARGEDVYNNVGSIRITQTTVNTNINNNINNDQNITPIGDYQNFSPQNPQFSSNEHYSHLNQYNPNRNYMFGYGERNTDADNRGFYPQLHESRQTFFFNASDQTQINRLKDDIIPNNGQNYDTNPGARGYPTEMGGNGSDVNGNGNTFYNLNPNSNTLKLYRLSWTTLFTFESPLTRIPSLLQQVPLYTRYVTNVLLTTLSVLISSYKHPQFVVFDYFDYYYNHDRYNFQQGLQNQQNRELNQRLAIWQQYQANEQPQQEQPPQQQQSTLQFHPNEFIKDGNKDKSNNNNNQQPSQQQTTPKPNQNFQHHNDYYFYNSQNNLFSPWMWVQRQLLHYLMVWSLGLVVFLHNVIAYLIFPLVVVPIWFITYIFSTSAIIFVEHIYSLFPSLFIDVLRFLLSFVLGIVNASIYVLIFIVSTFIIQIPALLQIDSITTTTATMIKPTNPSPISPLLFQHHHDPTQRVQSFVYTDVTNHVGTQQQQQQQYNQYTPQQLNPQQSELLLQSNYPQQQQQKQQKQQSMSHKGVNDTNTSQSSFSFGFPTTFDFPNYPPLIAGSDWFLSAIQYAVIDVLFILSHLLSMVWHLFVILNRNTLFLLIQTFSMWILFILNAFLVGFFLLTTLHHRCLHSPITKFIPRGPTALDQDTVKKDTLHIDPTQFGTTGNINGYSLGYVDPLTPPSTMDGSTDLSKPAIVSGTINSGSVFTSVLYNQHVLALLQQQLLQQELIHAMLGIASFALDKEFRVERQIQMQRREQQLQGQHLFKLKEDQRQAQIAQQQLGGILNPMTNIPNNTSGQANNSNMIITTTVPSSSSLPTETRPGRTDSIGAFMTPCPDDGNNNDLTPSPSSSVLTTPFKVRNGSIRSGIGNLSDITDNNTITTTTNNYNNEAGLQLYNPITGEISFPPTEETDILQINPGELNLSHLSKPAHLYTLSLGRNQFTILQYRKTMTFLLGDYFSTLHREAMTLQNNIIHHNYQTKQTSDTITIPTFLRLSPIGPYFGTSPNMFKSFVDPTTLVDFRQWDHITSYLDHIDVFSSLNTLLFLQLISVDFLPELDQLQALISTYGDEYSTQRDALPQLRELKDFYTQQTIRQNQRVLLRDKRKAKQGLDGSLLGDQDQSYEDSFVYLDRQNILHDQFNSPFIDPITGQPLMSPMNSLSPPHPSFGHPAPPSLPGMSLMSPPSHNYSQTTSPAQFAIMKTDHGPRNLSHAGFSTLGPGGNFPPQSQPQLELLQPTSSLGPQSHQKPNKPHYATINTRQLSLPHFNLSVPGPIPSSSTDQTGHIDLNNASNQSQKSKQGSTTPTKIPSTHPKRHYSMDTLSLNVEDNLDDNRNEDQLHSTHLDHLDEDDDVLGPMVGVHSSTDNLQQSYPVNTDGPDIDRESNQVQLTSLPIHDLNNDNGFANNQNSSRFSQLPGESFNYSFQIPSGTATSPTNTVRALSSNPQYTSFIHSDDADGSLILSPTLLHRNSSMRTSSTGNSALLSPYPTLSAQYTRPSVQLSALSPMSTIIATPQIQQQMLLQNLLDLFYYKVFKIQTSHYQRLSKLPPRIRFTVRDLLQVFYTVQPTLNLQGFLNGLAPNRSSPLSSASLTPAPSTSGTTPLATPRDQSNQFELPILGRVNSTGGVPTSPNCSVITNVPLPGHVQLPTLARFNSNLSHALNIEQRGSDQTKSVMFQEEASQSSSSSESSSESSDNDGPVVYINDGADTSKTKKSNKNKRLTKPSSKPKDDKNTTPLQTPSSPLQSPHQPQIGNNAQFIDLPQVHHEIDAIQHDADQFVSLASLSIPAQLNILNNNWNKIVFTCAAGTFSSGAK